MRTQERNQTRRVDKKMRIRKERNIRKATKRQTGFSTYRSTIILNINGINFPIKRHALADWIKKQYPTLCHL